MKTKTIQHPERYEAPGIKVKKFRKKRAMLMNISGNTPDLENEDTDWN